MKDKKKAGAWIAALATAALMACYALFALTLLLIEPEAMWFGFPLFVFLALPLAVIAGVFVALKQRLREIDAGEEDDAAKY